MGRSAGEADRSRRASVPHVLRIVARNPALLRVELAFATFKTGEWAMWLGMVVYAYGNGGVTESGIVATALLVPAALFAPVAAAVGDRHAPGRALLAGYVAEATACALVAAVLFAHVPSLIGYLAIAAPSIAFTTTRPAQAAFAPGLARRPEELTATNVVTGWIESISVLVAPVLAGALLAVGSPALVFAAMGIGCALGAFLVAPLRDAIPAAPARGSNETMTAGVGAGLRFVQRSSAARLLVGLLAAQCVALGALDVLYVEFAQAVLHRGSDWAGYLGGAFGGGGVLATGITARLVGFPRLAVPIVLSLSAWTVAFVGIAALPGLASALALLAMGGGARATFDVSGRTLLQRVAPPDLIARVFGLLEGLQMAALAVGTALAPALVALGGAPVAFVAVASVLPVAGLLAGRRVIDIDRHATVPVVEIALLRLVPLFSSLTPPTLESVARALIPVTAPPGTEVVSQGDEGDRFYVIADGELDVIADGNNVTTLRRGGYFGEIALMYDMPRTATVRARGTVSLYALDRQTFLVAITGHVSARIFARDLVEQRLQQLRELRDVERTSVADGGRTLGTETESTT